MFFLFSFFYFHLILCFWWIFILFWISNKLRSVFFFFFYSGLCLLIYIRFRICLTHICCFFVHSRFFLSTFVLLCTEVDYANEIVTIFFFCSSLQFSAFFHLVNFFFYFCFHFTFWISKNKSSKQNP